MVVTRVIKYGAVLVLFLIVLTFHVGIADAASMNAADAQLVRVSGSSRVYALLSNGSKHWIRSEVIFRSYGYTWDMVKPISRLELEKHPSIHLAKTKEAPTVWWVSDVRGLRKPHISEAVFLSYENKWSDIVTLSQEDMTAYRSVRLVQIAGSPKVYLVANGVKRWITTEQAFRRQSFAWEDIVIISSTDLNSYMDGAALDEVSAVLAVEPIIPVGKGGEVVVEKKTPLTVQFTSTISSEPIPTNTLQSFGRLTLRNNGDENITVRALTVHQTGLSGDADTGDVFFVDEQKAVFGGTAQFYDRRVTLRFSGNELIVPPSGKRDLIITVVIKRAGEMGVAFRSSLDIEASAPVIGAFPLKSAIAKSVAGTFFPSVTITNKDTSTSAIVSIGAKKYDFSTFVVENTSDADSMLIKSLRLTQHGSAVSTDIQSIELTDKKGAVLALGNLRGNVVTFSLDNKPFTLLPRAREELTVRANVIDGAGRTTGFTLNRPADVSLSTEEAGYQFLVSALTFPIRGRIFTIEGAEVFLTPSRKTPSGRTVAGAQDVVLALFDVEAGESDLVWEGSSLRIHHTGSHPLVENVRIRLEGARDVLATVSGRVASEVSVSFATRTHIPAKKKIVVEVVANIPTDADALDTYLVSFTDWQLRAGSAGLLMTKAEDVRGDTIGVSPSVVYVAKDTDLLDRSYTTGRQRVPIAQFQLTNNDAQSVRVLEIVLSDHGAADSVQLSNGLHHMEVTLGGRAFGASPSPSGGRYAFTSSDAIIKQGGSATLIVYVDSRSVANGKVTELSLTGLRLRGGVGDAVVKSIGIPNKGQRISFHTAKITVEQNGNNGVSSLAPSKDAVMVGRFIVRASKAEDIRLTTLRFSEGADSIFLATDSGVTSLSLRDSATAKRVGSVVTKLKPGGNDVSGFVVPAGESIAFDVMATLDTRASGLRIQTVLQDMKAVGVESKMVPTIAGVPTLGQLFSIQ